MSAFLSIRNDPLFRRYFDAISPFFWLVLYFQLKAAWVSLQREKRTGFLLAITWWGGVFIVHRGDLIETPKLNPFAPAKPRFDDPVWSTSVPACLETIASFRLYPILPCKAGEVSPQVTEGAFAPRANTS